MNTPDSTPSHEPERGSPAAPPEFSQFSEQIIASAQEGIIVFDRNLLYVLWNPFMEELRGVPAREVLGKHPLEIFPFLREQKRPRSLEKALADCICSS